MTEHRCDVAILGAGVNGCSIAYELSKRGKSVILIDKVVLGAGASGSCDDMILLQSKKPGILLEMAFKSLDLFEGLKTELPTDIEFETRGGTILIEDEEHLSIMEDFVASQNRYGLEVEIIDRKRLLELQPLVAEDIIASTYSARDSQVNPMLLMKAFLLGARQKGLRYVSRTRPRAIEHNAAGWKLLLDTGDLVEAEVLVNAAGAWANDITKLIGFEVPITPRKGQVIVTEAIPPLGETNVWSAQYIVSKLKPQDTAKTPVDGATPQTPAERFGLGFAFTGTHNGNYLIGSTRENRGFDKSTDPEAIGLLSTQVERFFPVMSKINFIRTFAGLRPSTPDGMPFLGEIPGAPGFFIAAGHEGDGIALSPITGLVMADLITGKNPIFPMEAFAPGRFGGKAGL
ncbi:MAG: FAD-dependent oxidoreductase [Spirochaetia bacterium]|jgi:sarcosine oxidase subunit beta|nr:FAD-dependent oxidoreductase [Spirochaetales bacterium]MDX9783710.1 FAD-dependent oxidoreductase [Spirochaetia bacterium]